VNRAAAFKRIAVYLVRGVTLLFAASIVCFVLVSLSPVDPVTAYRQANPGVSEENIARMEEFWGVNEPAVERYFKWGAAIIRGDFGESKIFRRPVIEVISSRFPATLALMLTAWVLSGVTGFAVGCLMGMKHGRLADRIIKRICLIMCSVPTFWLGLVFIMLFSVWLGLFPLGMAVPIGVASAEVTLWQRLHHLILPAVTLSFLSFANVALHTREKLVEVLQSEYVLFARARGESGFSILRRHGLRNILMPAVTMQFASFAELFGGSVIAENVFGFPGLGSAASAAGLQGDIPLLLGITMFSALFVFIGNAAANALYIVIDPRTSGQEQGGGNRK
jgi:peptide/nickel transport system permease protein